MGEGSKAVPTEILNEKTFNFAEGFFVPLIGQISNQFLCDLRGIAAFKGIFG